MQASTRNAPCRLWQRLTTQQSIDVLRKPVMQLLRDVEADQEYWAYKLIDLQEPTPPPSP